MSSPTDLPTEPDLDNTQISSAVERVDPELGAIATDDASFNARYELKTILGAGGMGEVRLYRDRRIGREVALKIVRAKHADALDLQARFLREARVQGQLEHPSIVPVYDLAAGPDGIFFSMKRVRGMTLEAIIAGLRNNDAQLAHKFSRRKLLTAISSVGLTLDYAHARGVLHRDLKPGNIMLGDFGEVYVLDWGLAKLAESSPASETNTATLDERVQEPQSSGPTTRTGAILGTPGYMAPEQLTAGDVDARTDIYALGSILFEILTLEKLHPQGPLTAMIASTIYGPARSLEPRDFPPELQTICTRATALLPEQRYASAREMVEAIERFLDGDRDLELRREIAARHATDAEALARHALDPKTSTDESTFARSSALRALGRALALDPANTTAAETMARVLVEAPKELPREAAEELEKNAHRIWRVTNNWRALGYAAWFLFMPLVWWMGIHDVRQDLNTIPMALCLILSLLVRKAKTIHLHATIATAILSSIGLAAASRVFGPLLMMPLVTALNTMTFAIQPIGKWRPWVIAIGASAVVVPLLLEVAGVVSPSYVFEAGAMTIVPHLVEFPRGPTLLFLALLNVWCVVIMCLVVAAVRHELYRSEVQLHRYAWQLRQLAPDHPELRQLAA